MLALSAVYLIAKIVTMHSYLSISLSLLLTAPSAHAWGTLGHATVAAIANNYLNDDAKIYVSDILGKNVPMASVASWADDYRYTSAGRFSAPFQSVEMRWQKE